jgi:transcription antitermination factor NusG
VATGEWVRIEAGPLSGVEGVLVKSKNAATVVISVELLQRSVAVEVDLKHVASVKTRSNAVHGRERR